ncbi:FNIP-M domain-containing protein [Aphelenchoides fujianensis]|nr:FNIP-M domain-containing protein [Aphelenchoides fujianensis]
MHSPPLRTIKQNSIRLAIFNEADHRLLYDSETIIPVEEDAKQQHEGARRSSCGRFQFLRHRKDVAQLARMVFGTLSNSTRKSSMKIHTFGNFVVLSRVFAVPKSLKFSSAHELKLLSSSFGSDGDTNSDYYATIRSLDTLRDVHARAAGGGPRHKNSSDPPVQFTRVRNSSLQLDGAAADEMRAFSPNQLSRARRKQLSLRGLASEGLQFGWDGRSRMSSCSSVNDADDPLTAANSKQLGFALIFPMDEKHFLFQHILQMEEEVAHLETAIYCATLAKTHFFHNVHNAYVRFGEAVCLLHNSARLRNPAWLSLMDAERQTETAHRFCGTLASLIERLERKETNFFLSTLLSTVLMNHLSWVGSVAPPDAPQHGDRSLLIGTNVLDGRKHPYNARMAQFMELCGSVGAGCRLAKTVVVGDNQQLISEILFVLSYFIRCSNVETKRPSPTSPLPPPPPPSFSHPADFGLSPPSLFDEEDGAEVPERVRSPTDHHAPFPHSGHPPPPHVNEHVALKRHSSSMSGSSPIGIFANGGGVRSSGNLDLRSDAELLEPPTKTRALVPAGTTTTSATTYRRYKPSSSHRMELLIDVHDVSTVLRPDLPFSTSLPAHPHASAFHGLDQLHSPTSSATTSSSQLTSPTSPNGGDLSRSLFAGICDAYSPYFILSGIHANTIRKGDDVNAAIHEDLKRHFVRQPWCLHQSTLSPSSSIYSSTGQMTASRSSAANGAHERSTGSRRPGPFPHDPRSVRDFVDSPRSQDSQRSHCSDDAACQSNVVVVVGDCNRWSVRAVTAESPDAVDEHVVAAPSEAVISMLEQFAALHALNSNPNFLISFLEDQLGGILEKSHTLVELVMASSDTSDLITEQLKNMGSLSKTEFPSRDISASKLPSDPCSSDDLEMFDEMGAIPGTRPLGYRREAEEDDQLISVQRVSSVIGCDCSDLRLILNVAAVYSPPVLSSAL